jgi:uroporphyrin-III C-methyltransferase / precorrin-2 dehydrogenase / sirohydrochlorin ferrochelatase
VTLAALPIFVRLAGRPVILVGEGEIAEAKRRLLERAGAHVVDETMAATLAIVAAEDPEPIVARLRERGVLVNTVDRPELCDFTLPAIVDRDPVLVAIGTGGVSAGLAAALRQRLEAVLPANLGSLARALHAARPAIRLRWPEIGERRRAIGAALAGPLDPLSSHAEDAVDRWLADADAPTESLLRFILTSPDPDDLSLRQARALAQADRVYHRGDVPIAILDRARADAARTACDDPPADPGPGLSVWLEMRG